MRLKAGVFNTVYTGSYSSHASEVRPPTKTPGPIYTLRYVQNRRYLPHMISIRKVQTSWCHLNMSQVFSKPPSTIYPKTDPSKVLHHQSGLVPPKTFNQKPTVQQLQFTCCPVSLLNNKVSRVIQPLLKSQKLQKILL